MKGSKVMTHIVKPHVCFLLIGAVFGLLYLILTPPFQSPDEVNHFFRAYQISEGVMLGQKQDDRVGGQVPVNVDYLVVPYAHMIGQMHEKTSAEKIKSGFELELHPEKKEFVDFPNTGIYPAISYVPQSVMLALGRWMGAGPLTLFYLGRLASLIFWLLCAYYAIRIVPFGKWLLTFLALLPMSVFVHASFSADVVTNGVAFLLIAVILSLAFRPRRITKKDKIVVIVLAIILASAKLVYSPILLLVLLIPKTKLGGNRNRWIQIGSLATISLAVVLAWSAVMGSLYTPYAEYNPEKRDSVPIVMCADMNQQLVLLKEDPWHFAAVVSNSVTEAGDMYVPGYIGAFGWLDSRLPPWTITLAYLIILVLILSRTEARINWKRRIILASSGVLMILLIILSQYLTWECVGDDFVGTLQGRYFIPVFPLFFLSLKGLINLRMKEGVLATVAALAFLSIGAKTLFERYYVEADFEVSQLICGFEDTKDNGFLCPTGQVTGKAALQNQEQAMTGRSSIQITPDEKYGMTQTFTDVSYGDVLELSVWRFGNSGSIAVSSGSFFRSASGTENAPSFAWQKLELELVVDQDFEEDVKVFLFNSSSNNAWFDDLSITYRKLR